MDNDEADEPAGWRVGTALAAPPELSLFAAFCVLATTSGFWLTYAAPPAVVDAVLPVVGWSAGTPYMFCLFFAVYLVFARTRLFAYRLALVAMLLFGAASGVWTAQPANDHSNPYLRVSPWRPAWTVAVPIAWSVALLAPPAVRAVSRARTRPPVPGG